jgi:hypothetical protein
VYDLPPKFNADLVSCVEQNERTAFLTSLSNYGMGDFLTTFGMLAAGGFAAARVVVAAA